LLSNFPVVVVLPFFPLQSQQQQEQLLPFFLSGFIPSALLTFFGEGK